MHAPMMIENRSAHYQATCMEQKIGDLAGNRRKSKFRCTRADIKNLPEQMPSYGDGWRIVDRQMGKGMNVRERAAGRVGQIDDECRPTYQVLG
jgi:hypothetical protein